MKVSSEMILANRSQITTINIITPKYNTFDLTMSIDDKKSLINLGY